MKGKISVAVILTCVATVAAQSCPLPTTGNYQWTSTEPLANAKTGWYGLKDFTTVPYNGNQLVYGTYSDGAAFGGFAFSPVSSFSSLSSATQTALSAGGTEPSLFYFRPGNIWVLAYTGGPGTFSYRTSSNPSNPSSWSSPQALFTGITSSGGAGHPALIADSSNIYLFFTDSFSKVYRSSGMALANFPGNFGSSSTVVLNDPGAFVGQAQWTFAGNVQVYTYGPSKYLMITEAYGYLGLYYRPWISTSLTGSWTPLIPSPTYGDWENYGAIIGTNGANRSWGHEINGCEFIRTNPDQTMTIDTCNLSALCASYVSSPTGFTDLTKLWKPFVLTAKFNTTPSSSSSSRTSTSPTSSPTGTVPQWGQCGGIGYTGPTVCQAPYTCQVGNPYYSQCK